jgi:hypothetical protein
VSVADDDERTRLVAESALATEPELVEAAPDDSLDLDEIRAIRESRSSSEAAAGGAWRVLARSPRSTRRR